MAGKDNQMSRLNKNKDNPKTSKTTKPNAKKKKAKESELHGHCFLRLSLRSSVHLQVICSS